MNLYFLDSAITIDFAMKLVVCAILFLAYLESKNKLFI